MQINIPKLIQRLESSTERKAFNDTALRLERRLNKKDETAIPVEESFPESWKDNYGKTHFYHPAKEMVLIQSREIWGPRLHVFRRK